MIRLLAVRLLRDGVHVHLAVEHPVRAAVEDALVQLAARAPGREMLDERLVVGVLRAVHHVQAVEPRFCAFARELRVDVRAAQRGTRRERLDLDLNLRVLRSPLPWAISISSEILFGVH